MGDLERLKGLLQRDPDNKRLWRDCVEASKAVQDYASLEVLAEQRLASRAEDAEALFELATARIGQQRYREAIDLLSTVDRIQPGIDAVHTNLALCHYQESRYGAAFAVALAAYRGGARSPGLLRLLIASAHHEGRYEEASAIAGAIGDAAAEDSALSGVLGLLYMDVGEEAPAARWSANALRLNSQSIDGALVQATLRLGQADVAGAREQFKSIVDRAPDLGRAWIGLGAVSMLENDLPTAQAMFRKGLEFMPDHVGSWQILGWCCLLGRDLDAAEEVFTHALELDRNFAECHGGIACVAALRGDRAAAERGIRVAQRLDPNCLSVVYAKSVLAGQSGDTERATKLIRDAVTGLAAGSGGLGALIGRVMGRSR